MSTRKGDEVLSKQWAIMCGQEEIAAVLKRMTEVPKPKTGRASDVCSPSNSPQMNNSSFGFENLSSMPMDESDIKTPRASTDSSAGSSSPERGRRGLWSITNLASRRGGEPTHEDSRVETIKALVSESRIKPAQDLLSKLKEAKYSHEALERILQSKLEEQDVLENGLRECTAGSKSSNGLNSEK